MARSRIHALVEAHRRALRMTLNDDSDSGHKKKPEAGITTGLWLEFTVRRSEVRRLKFDVRSFC
jgi:hypothetical protein